MKRLVPVLVVLVAALAAFACGGPTVPIAVPVVPPHAPPMAPVPVVPPDRDGRLPRTMIPTSYALQLDVDPRKERFSGHVEITGHTEPSTDGKAPYIVLNARNLHFNAVAARSSPPSAKVPQLLQNEHRGTVVSTRASVGSDAPDEVVVVFQPPLPASATVRLDFDYDAPFDTSLAGLYRAKDRGRDYAFTQFEATDARRAFPCFDEPAYRASFDVRVKVPREMTAVANAPEKSRTPAGNATEFVFDVTERIPTYLVALAVGELDVVEGRKTPYPVRIVTTKGRGESGRAALAPAAEIADGIASLLGVPYPFKKLDLVSVPDFSAGAMENPGLVTFREELLLQDPNRPSASATRARDHVIAHELAHQWFGDLVTMEWWNDIWLNESFATWLADRVLVDLRPQYQTRLGAVRGGLGVMDLDALSTARPVVREVSSVTDATQAFNGITYSKGAAVLRMLEETIGKERFRAGLKTYLEEHAFQNTRTEDLVAALAKTSTAPIPAIAKSFLQQTGVPTVSLERDCRRKDAAIVLSQFPWSPLGAPPPGQPLKQWTIPLCIREDGREPTCITLAERRAEVALKNGCKSRVYGNAAQASYARIAYGASDVPMLMAKVATMDPRERLGLLADLWAEVRSGQLAPPTFLTAFAAFDKDNERAVVDQWVDTYWGMSSVLADDARPALRDFAREHMKDKKRALTWGKAETILGAHSAGPDDDDTALTRRNVMYALAELGEDDATLREADLITRAWLANPKSVAPDTAALAVELGSRRADASRYEALVHAIKTLEEPQDRIVALRALTAFDDPNLVARGLDFGFSPDVNVKDLRYVFDGAFRHRRSHDVVLAWIFANWDRARKHLEGEQSRKLVDVVFNLCDRGRIEAARAFFKTKCAGNESLLRRLDEALDTANRCMALSEALGPALADALRGAAPRK